MSNEISLVANYPAAQTASVPTCGISKKVGRFFFYTVPALVAVITAKAGGDVISL